MELLQLLFVILVFVVVGALLWSGILWIVQAVEERRHPHGRRPRSKPGLPHQTFGEMFLMSLTVLGGTVLALVTCVVLAAVVF